MNIDVQTYRTNLRMYVRGKHSCVTHTRILREVVVSATHNFTILLQLLYFFVFVRSDFPFLLFLILRFW